MDSLALAIALVLFLWASFHIINQHRRRNLPPGPYPFPIIGNLLQLGQNPHHSFAKLSRTYGPLMSLQLGRIYAVVVTSPEVAKVVFRKHDEALSSRHVTSAAEAHDFHINSMAFLPVGSRWRKIRKVCREHLFSSRRLDESKVLRQEKLTKLRDYLHECSVAGCVVNVGEAVFTIALNLITFTLFSLDFATFDSDDRVTQELKETVERVVTNLGTPNLADFFPLLKPFDLQGIKRESEFYVGKLLDKFEEIIIPRVKSGGQNKLSIKEIKYLILDLFLGETHTISSTVEWAMTELLLNPSKMANATNELRSVIGKNKQVKESDISRLPYLQAMIKETLRIHPPGPLLVPRKADYQVEINGYTIPKNAQIFVNVWAIGRDSSIWPNPDSFEPERFLNSQIDYKGRDFALLPFGSGRRTCPGLPFVDRILPLVVASFIHEFDWKLEQGVKPEDVDTTEKFGMAVHKAVPLMAIPIPVNV